MTTTAATRRTTTRTSPRTGRKSAQTASIAPDFSTAAGVRAHIAWLQAQAHNVDDNVADMKQTFNRIGEASDYRDARLPELDVAISFWSNRRDALLAQLRDARTLERTLAAREAKAAQATAQATSLSDHFITAPRGAQPIIREAW